MRSDTDRSRLDAIVRAAQETAPVKVVDVARQMGLRVFAADLDGGISGKICRDGGSSAGWSISVNKHEPETRRRFTIAHEIGHYVLHADIMGEGVQDDVFYRSELTNQQETEANRYAADLLMPWSLINRIFDGGEKNPDEIARILNVSNVALYIKLGLPT